jgi:adenylate cyclase
VVKRLGDGMMAVFAEPADAVAAIFAARERIAGVTAEGYEPRLRAGLHTGRPERVGDDYLGVDVNVAARVADAAGPDEVLVTHRVVEALGDAAPATRRKRLFRAKGVPSEVKVFRLESV